MAKVKVNFEVDKELYKQFKVYCAKSDRKIKDVLITLIERIVKGDKK